MPGPEEKRSKSPVPASKGAEEHSEEYSEEVEESKREEVDRKEMPLALVAPDKEELAEEPKHSADREVACRPGLAQMPKLSRALENKVLVKKADATAYDEVSEDSYDEESCGEEEEVVTEQQAGRHSSRDLPPVRAAQVETQAVVATHAPRDLVLAEEPMPELGALPQPGLDFHCMPPPTEKAKMLEQKSLPNEFFKNLTSRDLEGMGMTICGGSSSSSARVYRCQLCELDVQEASLPQHLDTYFKAGQRHKACLDGTVEALQQLKLNGWRLKYEQIVIYKKQYHCKICFDKQGKPRRGGWFEVFMTHLGTQGHLKALRCAGLEVPAQPSSLERREWDELMRPYISDSSSPAAGAAEGQRWQRSRSRGETISAARVVVLKTREAAHDVAQRSRRKRTRGRSSNRRSPRRPKGWPRRSRSRSRRSQSPTGGGGSRRGEPGRRSSRRRERRRRSSSDSRPVRGARRARRHASSAGSATNYEPVEELVHAVAEDVRFSQDTIAPTFSDGKTFDRLIGELHSGKVHPSRDDFLVLDAFRGKRGCLFSLNNRRLHCLKEFEKQLGKPLKISLKVQRMTPEQQAMLDTMVQDATMQRIVRGLSTKDKGCSVQIRQSKNAKRR
eukprot:TRINITY_DN29486_c0_g1_i1.p1 TRINITY_DN29486_c0_g1~~TRINITY_DN29486_c0_g1_i1.p1  ORF type:complete len:708 (-),score=150.52 TRINITY_DN29486_c0_g1_i1:56-1903(-)